MTSAIATISGTTPSEAGTTGSSTDSMDVHPFLTGIHTPMSDEITIDRLTVAGRIPVALDGRYLRIGPNPAKPDPAGYHWFIGDGMVHGIALQGGEALWYRNRWVRSDAVAAVIDQPAASGGRDGALATVNTNVVSIAGRTFAVVEAGSYPVELSDTLDGQQYSAFGGTLENGFSGHPHFDPLLREHHAITYDATDPTTVRHVVVSDDGSVVRQEPVAVQHGPSIHDCAITARYAVILDLPVTFSQETMMAGHRFPYRWNTEHQARIGLLPRLGHGDETIWIPLAPCYIFHVVNAYDRPDRRIVMDAIVYDTMFAREIKGPDGSGRGLERWTIDPEARTVERRTLDATPQEFPRMDDRRAGQPYRYAYTIGLPDTVPGWVGETYLLKHDLDTGKRSVHDFGRNRYPGEFVFVPASPTAAEDEGWLIGLVIDMTEQTTDLVLLDARDFAGVPVASIRIPHRIPPGFHGNWFPA